MTKTTRQDFHTLFALANSLYIHLDDLPQVIQEGMSDIAVSKLFVIAKQAQFLASLSARDLQKILRAQQRLKKI